MIDNGFERQLERVLQEHPSLNMFGMGLCEPHKLTKLERVTKLRELREELLEDAPTVAEIAHWLEKNVECIKTINRRYSSYTLKHTAERRLGFYVSNGQFIAAALTKEYPYRHVRGPNVYFAMSHKSIKELGIGEGV